MGFTKTFPYNTGTFVIVDEDSVNMNNPKSLLGHFGSIACYQCVDEDDELMVMVSGYKSAWCGEYLLNEIRLATEEEISIYENLIKNIDCSFKLRETCSMKCDFCICKNCDRRFDCSYDSHSLKECEG